MAVIMQVIGTVIICNLCMCMGIIFAWPSSTLRLFESANTTLHRPMTEPELALFGSLSSIGALIGTPVIGFCLDRFGRKNSAIMGSLMSVLAWALVAISSRVEVILTALFISGLNGAVFLVVPVFVSEICDDSIRGAMCSGTIIFYGIGLLISYMLGGFLSYNGLIYASLSITALTTAGLSILKESPTCLMIKGMEQISEQKSSEFLYNQKDLGLTRTSLISILKCVSNVALVGSYQICFGRGGSSSGEVFDDIVKRPLTTEAAKSVAFYKGLKADSKEVQEVISVIKRTLSPELDDMTPEEEKQLKPEKEVQEKLSLWKFIRKSRSSRAAIYLTLTLLTASIFQGMVVVQVYAIPLFEDAIPSMSSTLCSILVAVIGIAAGLVAAYLTEVAGRRLLMIYSAYGCAASCLLLGLQIHLHWGPSWLIAVNIYVFTVMFNVGGGVVPYVLIGEVFLPEVRSFMSMLVIEWAWLCNSIILFIFNPLVKVIGLGPVFYLFAGIGIITGIYSMIYLPETKGLSIDAIQAKLVKKKKNDVVY